MQHSATHVHSLAPAAPIDSASVEMEKGLGEAQDVELIRSTNQRMLTVAINLLVIIELTIAMYMASRTPDTFTPIFFKVFFSTLVPTLIASWVARRVLTAREKA